MVLLGYSRDPPPDHYFISKPNKPGAAQSAVYFLAHHLDTETMSIGLLF